MTILRRRIFEAIDLGLVDLEPGREGETDPALSAHSFRVGLTDNRAALRTRTRRGQQCCGEGAREATWNGGRRARIADHLASIRESCLHACLHSGTMPITP